MIDFEEELEEYKQKYMESLKVFIQEKNQQSLIDCMTLGNKYFNFAEKSIAATKLAGIHDRGLALIDIAESCYEILNSYIKHIDFLESNAELLQGAYTPPEFVGNNMQRMVKKYLPDKVKELKGKFVEKKLSTRGFDMKAPSDKKESKLPLCIGTILLGFPSIALMFYFQTPTPYQFFVCRVCIALGGGAIATYIPGWLHIDLKAYKNKVKAGGAIAAFVLLYFYTPDLFLTNL